MSSHALVMIATKERIESAALGTLRYGKKLLVAGALLRLGKDTNFHVFKLTVLWHCGGDRSQVFIESTSNVIT